MAKRKKGKSGSGESQYLITQLNLDRKGKTNKKLKRNPMAQKNLTPRGRELKEAAAEYVKLHPPGSGKKKQAKLKEIEKRVEAAA
jgi:hypothetical protein